MNDFDVQCFLIELAQRIRRTIFPLLNAERARIIQGTAHSGDVTFQLDVVAEQEVEKFLDQKALKIAYYTEDKGLVNRHQSPEKLLIIDPIDGTRPAFSGFESAVVSIAMCPFSDNPTFKDISHAVILELKTGNLFYAEAGKGVLLQGSDPNLAINPSRSSGLESLRWSFEFVGRPVAGIIKNIGSLIDYSSFKGGIYIFNSSAFAITRLVTGQLDAYIDITGLLVDEGNSHTPQQHPSGSHQVMGLFAYDIAAAFLIAREANCIITDSGGDPLDNQSLVAKDILSCVAASNAELHRRLLEWLYKKS